jgi:hypothetical protein
VAWIAVASYRKRSWVDGKTNGGITGGRDQALLKALVLRDLADGDLTKESGCDGPTAKFCMKVLIDRHLAWNPRHTNQSPEYQATAQGRQAALDEGWIK